MEDSALVTLALKAIFNKEENGVKILKVVEDVDGDVERSLRKAEEDKDKYVDAQYSSDYDLEYQESNRSISPNRKFILSIFAVNSYSISYEHDPGDDLTAPYSGSEVILDSKKWNEVTLDGGVMGLDDEAIAILDQQFNYRKPIKKSV